MGAYPISITASMDAIYVANGESNTVSVINPANNTIIKNITVGVIQVLFMDLEMLYT